MSRIYTSLPPENSKIAIAFSGGLDTRTAVLWLAQKKLKVYAFTADLAQPDEQNVSEIPKIALEHGASSANLIDCKKSLADEALVALRCGAFHIQTAGRKYYNTTPLGRVVTSVAIVKEMQKNNVQIFGDGSTHKGNDIQRFYRYGVLLDPEIKIYKPWLDKDFVNELGGRSEMSTYLSKNSKPYSMSIEKAYSTDSNFLGATHEAKDLEFLDKNMYSVAPIMGVAFWKKEVIIENEILKIEFQNGIPISINDIKYDELFLLIQKLNEIGGKHGIGMSDQIENRVIEAKSRGIYEAPGMALLHIAYERLLSTIHNENVLDLYFTLGRKLARLLYEGRWFDPEAYLIKNSLNAVIGKSVSGYVVIELRRGDDYTILETSAPNGNYNPHKLSMEKTLSAFDPIDRIGSLHIQDLGIEANRNIIKNLD